MITPAELLKRIPKLTERRLQYLVRSGYIPFKEVPQGEVIRRQYDENDLPYVEYLISLLEQNMSPKKAYLQAKKEFPDVAKRLSR